MTDRPGAKTGRRICLPETLSLLRNDLCWPCAANKCQYCRLVISPCYYNAESLKGFKAIRCGKKHKGAVQLQPSVQSTSFPRSVFSTSDLLARRIINVFTDKQSETHLW